MIKSENDIQWTVMEGPGQAAAVRNYFEALSPEEKDALRVLWVEPGRIVGYDDSGTPVRGFLYDADTGRLIDPTLENYMMLPIYCELHFDLSEDERRSEILRYEEG